MNNPSEWLLEHYTTFKPGGDILDLACGAGRHAIFLQEQGYQVTAVDIDTAALEAIQTASINVIRADLEGAAWPFGAEQFDGIVVVNYLWRPLFGELIGSLKPGGVMGLWSDARADEAFVGRMAKVFSNAWSEPVTFHNPLQDKPFTQTVYLART